MQHLIHIGYPKAGSTFLQRWFERHPQLRFADGGLGGFHDVYSLAQVPERSYRYYVTSSETLSSPYTGAGGLSFEEGGKRGGLPHRIKDAQAEVCAVLKTLYPASRILIVTRGFRDIALSGYSRYVSAGGVLHLEEMLQYFVDRLGEDVSDQYDFDYLIRLYAASFGRENLIVLPYELLRDDQPRFVRLLEARLALEHVELDLGRVNASLSPEELYWYPLISRAALGLASCLGSGRRERAFDWYARRTADNRLRSLVGLLSRVRPGGKITGANFPERFLLYCRGKAESLRGDPLYAPYAAEYLWDTDAPPSRHTQ